MNKKNISNKFTNSQKMILLLIVSAFTLLLLIFFLNSEIPDMNYVKSSILTDSINNLSLTHTELVDTNSYFHIYLTLDDVSRVKDGGIITDGIKITLNEKNREQLIADLLRNDKSVVIYPVFTSAAYKEPGFYTYYAGQCDQSCVTDLSFENPDFQFTSSGATAQILYHIGYDFLTDIDVDQNPDILDNYDTVILLHNEYVTKKQFDAISNHQNLIFLHPNALYAEIDVNYDTNTMTLIRGHSYPPEDPVKNGFNYEIEERFHDFEYDVECIDWKFIEIENGYHLNCYPESVIFKKIEILKKMKEL